MVLAKICGIKSVHDAQGAAVAGADFLGFHVELEGGRSPLTPEAAAEMIVALPEGATSVVVTSVVEPQRLIELARTTGAKIVQLYGDAAPEAIIKVKAALPAVQVWKVINVSGDDALKKAEAYEGAADAIALDSAPKPGRRGGTGETHDWNISKKIVSSVAIPVVLAGGLNAENVIEAIQTVLPYAVDVNSGVSNPDGSKDLAKVEIFVARAKSL
jgi:phosphoribosylanthranilate isomerase